MKKLLLFILLLLNTMFYFACQFDTSPTSETHQEYLDEDSEEISKRTRIDEAFKRDFEMTKDPALGYPPVERLHEARRVIKEKEAQLKTKSSAANILNARWRERGPYDVGGRTRTIVVDQNDPTNKTVFAAGITGGLWRTRDITANEPYWENLGDMLENLNISSIAQDPTNPNIMYFCTGEGYTTGGSSGGRGLGIWKSVDSGDTWDNLPATANGTFYYSQRMLVHPNGEVYVATRSDGVQRSQDGGQTWERVLTARSDISDIQLGPDGSIYCATGFVSGGGRVYKTPAGPGIGDTDNWQWLTGPGVGFPASFERIEIAVSQSDPGTIYALVENGGDAQAIYRTANDGQNWLSRTVPRLGDENSPPFTRGQGWYDLCIAVDPNNADRIIIGGITLHMSTNGGNSWSTALSPNTHVDQHFIMYEKGNSNVIYFGNDGGIWRTENGAAAPVNIRIRHKNSGYNVTQFYACAMHPDKYSDYFLAGSQDNNSIQFDSYEIDRTRAVLGGDGMYCHIDQNEPQYQLASSQFGNYALSNNGGQSFDAGGIGADAAFVAISQYDSDANILYVSKTSGTYYRWDISQAQGEIVNITSTSSTARHIAVSPNIDNRIYYGLAGSAYVIVDNAHEGVEVEEDGEIEIQVEGEFVIVGANGSISCIEVERGNEDHILVTQSNYGVESVLESTDGGATWQSVEGDLPDMPVRWVVFNPVNADQAFIATEMGVWATDNLDGDNTVWMPQTNGLPNVRCDMLQTRTSDNFVAVGTHGRGLFSTDGLADPLVRINVPQVGYADEAVQFVDYSINPSTWMWDFGDGETATVRDPEHTYDEFGIYPVSVTIEGNQSAASEIKILPQKDTPDATGGSDYTGDFENPANTDFGVNHISGSRFERGNSGMPGKSGTHSGDNAWVVGIDEPYYENNTETMLYTPKYDLTEAGIYVFSFWAKYDIQQGFDGFRIEYSTDGGRAWSVLGERGDDWYNFDNSNSGGGTVFPTGSQYFTGKTSGNNFKKFKTNISDLSGNDVAFRFVFRTNGMGIFAGLALDDVEITALKTDGDLRTIITDFSGNFPSNTELSVNWKTKPEYRSDFFEVEYSINGRDWMKFSEGEKIAAAGFSIDEVAYVNEYSNEKRPLYYLRIKATDLDGENFYSDIIVLRRNIEEQGIYRIYPNPFSDHINVAFNGIINDDIVVEMYDVLGRKVGENTVNVPDVYTRIDLGSLAKGTYVIRITIGEETYTQRIVRG